MSYFDGIIYFNNNVPFLGNKILNVFQNLMLKLEILLQENWAVHQIAKILVLCVSLIKYQKTENSDFLAFIFRPTVSKYLYWRLRSDPNRVVLDYLKIDIHLKDLWQNAFENHWPPISSKHWIDCFSRNFIIHLHKISLWELLEWYHWYRMLCSMGCHCCITILTCETWAMVTCIGRVTSTLSICIIHAYSAAYGCPALINM